MAKEEKTLFLRVFVIALFIFFINLGLFIYDEIDVIGSKGLSGFSVKSTIKSTISDTVGMPLLSKSFLIIQWGLICLLLVYTFFKDKTIRKDRREFISINLNKKRENQTDLDLLYDVLKDKKELKLSTIARAFKVNEDIAMEWCKILESGELAVIDYPGFGEPVIKIESNEEKHKKLNKKDEKKKSKEQKKKNKISMKTEKQEAKIKKRLEKAVKKEFKKSKKIIKKSEKIAKKSIKKQVKKSKESARKKTKKNK